MSSKRHTEEGLGPQLIVGPGPCNNSELRKATRHLGQLFDKVMRPSRLRAPSTAFSLT